MGLGDKFDTMNHNFGISTLIIGAVAMSIFWMIVLPGINLLVLIVAFILAIISIIFGSISYLSKMQAHPYGLAGCFLGISIIVEGPIIFLLTSAING